ncbi:integrase catalytic domain-containing protein [Trichonephila clavipes]|nr:integrase catalytic domain-containing protein [Trichonephila clavipes]
MGISWDVELPLEMRIKFEKWKSWIPLLKELSILRYLLKNSSPYAKVTMHIFCDASQYAYAACVFIRTEFENNISCELVQARNHVSPIKKMTIPPIRIVILYNWCQIQHKAVKEDLEFDESIPVYYWSDSSNALYWITKNENWSVHVFNRVQEVRKLTNPAKWRHISGSLNSADLPSRGYNIENLSRSRW